jgi:DNA-directed RNA polymerase subunit RPC12/RpoP
MSETKIKIEPVCGDYKQIESVDSIENNIKKEPEVEFLLILPPRQVKIETIEEEVKEQKQNENKFQCQQCPKSFDTREVLRNHVKTHEPKVKCQTCNKKFSIQSLRVHLKRHEKIRKFNCDHCSAGLDVKSHLIRHIWKHRSDKLFNCAHCNRVFNHSVTFKAHFLTHSTNPRPRRM